MKKILTTTALVGSTLLASATMSSAQVSITGQLDLGYKAQSTSNTAANSYRGFTRESQLNFGYKGKLNNGIGFNAGFSWEVDSNEDATTAAINAMTAENTYLDLVMDKTTLSFSADHVQNPDFEITNIAGGKSDIDDVVYGTKGATGKAYAARNSNSAYQAFGFGLTQDFGVAKASVIYSPSRTSGLAGADNTGGTKGQMEEGNSQIEFMLDGNFGVQGLRAFYYQGVSESDSGSAANNDLKGRKIGASYNFGQFTLAASQVDLESTANTNNNTKRKDIGAAYAVNKDLTIGVMRTTTAVDALVTETLKGINIGYNLGPVTLNTWYATADDFNGVAGQEGKTLMFITTTKF